MPLGGGREIGPFPATFVQDGLVECDQLEKVP